MNHDQIIKLLDAARNTEIYLPLLFALVLGLRRGEAMGMCFSDFDFDKGSVHIQRQITVVKSSKESKTGETEYGFSTLKTEESDRVLYVPQPVLQAVKEQQSQCRLNRVQYGPEYINHDLVCCNEKGGFYNPNTMYTKYKNLLAQLGLPSIRFHDLRHSYATAMIENNVPLKTVSHMLGHTDIGITANIYCDVINSHKEAAAIAETCFFNKSV
ncbi:Tyrosine recombinase XerC [bioreactor metagenome]|uniref:Tyrosine recombinase XerC n=1 Tax=bioreactor metagenome TaxID=1076179 RepID=A0A645FWJ0_9ZZZZ